MALRKILAAKLPEPPDQAPGLRSMVDQTLAAPQLLPARMFWENLNALRPWWPILAPLLVWVFVRKYQRERARYLAERAPSE